MSSLIYDKVPLNILSLATKNLESTTFSVSVFTLN